MLEKIEERRNEVIGRSELKLLATVEGGTPSRADVVKAVTERLRVEPNRLALVKIEPSFGSSKSVIHVRVYDNPETLLFFEPRYRLKRQGLIVEGKKGEKAAA